MKFFLSKVISPKVPNWSSDLWSKAVSNIDWNSPRNSTFKVFPRYGPLRRIFLCGIGHYGEFGCALWAIVADLVIRYRPLQQIWLCTMVHCAEWSCTVKICIDFCAIGHSAGFMRYGPLRRVWLSAMGHSKESGWTLWAVGQDWVMRYRPYPLKGQWCKKWMYMNSTCESLHHQSFKSLVSAKIIGSPQWPIAQYEFRIRITWRIGNRIRKKI